MSNDRSGNANLNGIRLLSRIAIFAAPASIADSTVQSRLDGIRVVLPITNIAKHKIQMAQCLLYVLGVGASLPQEMESSRWRLRKLKALGCFAGKN
jgi:hypothetical protein